MHTTVSKREKSAEQMVGIAPARIGAVPGYATLSAREGLTSYELTVEPETHSSSCIYPPCSEMGITPVKYGRKWLSFAHTPIAGKPCTIRVHRQRYLCPNCGRTHSDPLPGLDPRRRLSVSLASYVRKHVNRSNTDLAEEIGVSPNTIQHLIDDFAAEIRATHRSGLRVLLGMDEIYLKRKPYCVFADIGKHCHFCLLPDNSDDTIKAALREYPNRDAVQVVVIDLMPRYRKIAHELLPDAVVAIDLFHVLQLADQCREQVRIQAAQRSYGDARKALNGRRGFWERFDDLDGWLGGQENLFGALLPSLAIAHETYIKFCLAFHTSKTSLECAHRYDDWLASVPDEMRRYFFPLIDAADKFRDEIFRYVDFGLTNGFTEGNNSSIRNQFRAAPHSSYQSFSSRLIARAERKYRKSSGIINLGEAADESAEDSAEQDASIITSIERSRQMSARRNRLPGAKLEDGTASRSSADVATEQP